MSSDQVVFEGVSSLRKEPKLRDLIYALVVAYYEGVVETGKVALLFRSELWGKFRKVLERAGYVVPDFNEVHKELWSFFTKLMMDRFSTAKTLEEWGVKGTILALDYSPHRWIDGGIEVLVRLRGVDTWEEVRRRMEYEYRAVKQRLMRSAKPSRSSRFEDVVRALMKKWSSEVLDKYADVILNAVDRVLTELMYAEADEEFREALGVDTLTDDHYYTHKELYEKILRKVMKKYLRT